MLEKEKGGKKLWRNSTPEGRTKIPRKKPRAKKLEMAWVNIQGLGLHRAKVPTLTWDIEGPCRTEVRDFTTTHEQNTERNALIVHAEILRITTKNLKTKPRTLN